MSIVKVSKSENVIITKGKIILRITPLRKTTIYQGNTFLYLMIIVISKVEHLRVCFDLFT